MATWADDSGQVIQRTETHFFRWLRKKIKAPQLLDKYTMGAPAGASETFSNSILTREQVIEKIEQLLEESRRVFSEH